MKPMNVMAAATALVMAATPAFSANWIYVTTSGSGSVFYYDAETLQRSGSRVTVWRKDDHSLDKTAEYRESRDRYRYDCTERTRTLLNSTNYYPDGKIETLTYETYEQNERQIAPDTVGDAILEAVCAAKAP